MHAKREKLSLFLFIDAFGWTTRSCSLNRD